MVVTWQAIFGISCSADYNLRLYQVIPTLWPGSRCSFCAATLGQNRLRIFTLWNTFFFFLILSLLLSPSVKPHLCIAARERPYFIGIGVSTDLSNLFSRFPKSKRKAELEYPSKMAAIKEEREVEDYKRKGRRSSQVR